MRDGEEGYTGKRGFATAEIIDIDCSGLSPVNPASEQSQITSELSLISSESLYNMGSGPKVVATFNFDDGMEVVSFPEFNQGNLIAKANASFELVGSKMTPYCMM